MRAVSKAREGRRLAVSKDAVFLREGSQNLFWVRIRPPRNAAGGDAAVAEPDGLFCGGP
ncbi:MAG: hypothetical protein ACI9DC_001668 [Gammaproteobacteria bacterium]|jgi:hypothetical protein